MKFFYKIFLSMLFVLTVSLATVEYLTVSYSLEHALQREENTAFSQHQMVKYSIQTVLLSITDSYTKVDMAEIARSAEAPLGAQSGLYFAMENKEKSGSGAVYYDSCKNDPSQKSVEDGKILYEIETKAGNRYLQVRSSFSLKDSSYVLVTEKKVEELFQDAENLRRRCELFYWCILGAGSFLVLILTLTITRPLGNLRNTTRKFATGEYDVRAKTGSRDEVGELAKTFNYMAKTIENKIVELEDAARRQEDFTANLAHELNPPMTSIIGDADTLYQKTLPPEEVHQLAGIIMNEGMRLEALSFKMMELVTLSRSDFQLEEARIDEVMADAVETITPAAAKRKIQIKLQAEEAWVRLEYDLFKTLLLNLMDNALKSGTDVVLVQGSCENGQYKITITDRGRGIPPEDLEKITEAFYMVDKSRSRKEHGAGLGLALAVKIAQLHHTTLSYRSQPGQGTSVTFVLQKEADDEEKTD